MGNAGVIHQMLRASHKVARGRQVEKFTPSLSAETANVSRTRVASTQRYRL